MVENNTKESFSCLHQDQHIHRYIEDWIAQYLPLLRAVSIEGARGVGKTVSAKRFAETLIYLDRENERTALEGDYERLWTEAPPILLDEWQYLPEVWDRVRRMVDDHIPPGTFLLTGSMQSTNKAIHSGAGRIIGIRMRPLSLAERFPDEVRYKLQDCLDGKMPERIDGISKISYQDYINEIVRSGFPAIYQADEGVRKLEIESYLERISHRDFDSQGVAIRHPGKMMSWLRAYAAATGTTTSYNKMLDAATAGEDQKPSKETAIAYREALRSLWLIDDLHFWWDGGGFLGRLKQTPKHYLADPALEAYLLGLSERDLITGKASSAFDADYGSIAGRLFESLCNMSLRTYATTIGADIGYVRTQKGNREIDFVVQKNQCIVAIEVKLSPTVDDSDVRHLNWFEEKIGDRIKEKIILTTGSHAYRRPKDRVLVIPAALFG
jgi:predicted AAA+ superfamily ATPase